VPAQTPGDTCGVCGAPLVCAICESCAKHCLVGDPWACWEAHERWRRGEPDQAFGGPTTSRPLPPEAVPPAPFPRMPRPTKSN
jgi:hypothetical protein